MWIFRFFSCLQKKTTKQNTSNFYPFLKGRVECLPNILDFTSMGKVSMTIYSHIWGLRCGRVTEGFGSRKWKLWLLTLLWPSIKSLKNNFPSKIQFCLLWRYLTVSLSLFIHKSSDQIHNINKCTPKETFKGMLDWLETEGSHLKS